MEDFLKANSFDGSIAITLSDGTKVGLNTLKDPPAATAQDIRNVVAAFLKLVENLDKRLAVVKGRTTGEQWASTLPGPQGGDIPRRKSVNPGAPGDSGARAPITNDDIYVLDPNRAALVLMGHTFVQSDLGACQIICLCQDLLYLLGLFHVKAHLSVHSSLSLKRLPSLFLLLL